MHKGRYITVVVAMDRNRVIGRGGDIPWHLPADRQHFEATTMGHPVIMGRKTFVSIGRALPGRQNIVISRDTSLSLADCLVVNSLDSALDSAEQNHVMIIGGGQIYRLTLPHADRLVVTLVDTEVTEGDTRFPDYDADEFWVDSRQSHFSDEKNALYMEFFDLLRKSSIDR